MPWVKVFCLQNCYIVISLSFETYKHTSISQAVGPILHAATATILSEQTMQCQHVELSENILQNFFKNLMPHIPLPIAW